MFRCQTRKKPSWRLHPGSACSGGTALSRISGSHGRPETGWTCCSMSSTVRAAGSAGEQCGWAWGELAAVGPGTASAQLWQAADTWQHLQQKLGVTRQVGTCAVCGLKQSTTYGPVVLQLHATGRCAADAGRLCISAKLQSGETVIAECC